IERLFAKAVACKGQRPERLVPYRYRKHADSTPDGFLDPPSFESSKQSFCIRMPAPKTSLAFASFGCLSRRGNKLFAQIAMVVDLAVEHYDIAAACRHHRLMPRRREVQNSEPFMTKRHPGTAVHPYSLIIRAAMMEGSYHRPDSFSEGIPVCPRINKTGYSAHVPSSPDSN